MKITRREMVKLGAAAGVAATIDPSILLGGTLSDRSAGPRTRPIPSTGEEIPVVGIGTARRYDVGTSAAEREPLKETLAVFHDLDPVEDDALWAITSKGKKVLRTMETSQS